MNTLILLRIVTSCSLVLAIAIGMVRGSVHDAYQALIASLVFAGIPLLIAATEPEALPPRTLVPHKPWLALLVAPWLPGGGRGALFLLLHLLAAFVTICCFRAATGEATTRVFHIGVTGLSATAFVLGWCAVMRRRLETERGRAATRALIAGSMFACWVCAWYLDSEASHSIGKLAAQVMSAPLMGQYITNSGDRYAGHPASLPILSLLVLAAIAGNMSRIVRGLRGVVERISSR